MANENLEIVLVRPDYPSYPDRFIPIGLGHLGELLEKNDIRYRLVDLSQDGHDALYRIIERYRPKYVGIMLVSLDVHHNYSLIRNIKQKYPYVNIIAGGPHISALKEEALYECEHIDYGVVKEGEETLIELLRGKNLFKIKGLMFRDEKNHIVYNGDRPFLKNLDGLPYPRYNQMDLTRYGDTMAIASSRGCPYSCIFCGAHLSMGKPWRARSARSVFEEIQYWNNRGYKKFSFVDSNFFHSRERVQALCELLEDNNIDITSIDSHGMRCNDANYEMLKKMKLFGLSHVALGIESANDDILKSIKKGECLEDIEDCLRLLKKLEISVIAFFIIGLPGETVRHVLRSFVFGLKHWNIRRAYFFNPNPVPGTELYSVAEEMHYLRDNGNLYDNIGGMGKDIQIETPQLSKRKRKFLNAFARVVSFLIAEKYRFYTIVSRTRRKGFRSFVNDSCTRYRT